MEVMVFENIVELSDAEIVIVDDSKVMRTILVECLNGICNLKEFESAELAISYCKKASPDLILMDWELEGISGLEACQLLQSSSATSHIPIIFVTGNAEKENQLKCWDAGAVDFVAKPIIFETLLNRVKTHLKYKLQADLLKEYSFVDGLTGVYNRRYFNIEIEKLFKHSQRYKKEFSIVMVDVDFFKKYNDFYGHIMGDELLIKIAEKLKIIARRPLDNVFRYGGEEFVVLLPDTTTEGAKKIAINLVSSVEEMQLEHRQSPFEIITVSAGVASSNYNSYKTTLEEADKALYLAKESGRNRAIQAKYS